MRGAHRGAGRQPRRQRGRVETPRRRKHEEVNDRPKREATERTQAAAQSPHRTNKVDGPPNMSGQQLCEKPLGTETRNVTLLVRENMNPACRASPCGDSQKRGSECLTSWLKIDFHRLGTWKSCTEGRIQWQIVCKEPATVRLALSPAQL